MKSKILLILVILIAVNANLAKAQAIFAGDMAGGYFDINPDKNLYYPTAQSYTDNLSLDMVGNYLMDIRFNLNMANYGGGSVSNISLESLNSTTSILLGRTDTTHQQNGQNVLSDIIKPLFLGDSLNPANGVWKNGSLDLLRYDWFNTGNGLYIVIINDWAGLGDRYIAVRNISGNDTLFGWVRVNCVSSTSCFVKDYSRLITGLNKLSEDDNFSLYPNPIKDKLYIKLKNNVQCKSHLRISNTLGDVLLDERIDKPISSLERDLTKFANGIYFLQLQVDDGTIQTRKIILSH